MLDMKLLGSVVVQIAILMFFLHGRKYLRRYLVFNISTYSLGENINGCDWTRGRENTMTIRKKENKPFCI